MVHRIASFNPWWTTIGTRWLGDPKTIGKPSNTMVAPKHLMQWRWLVWKPSTNCDGKVYDFGLLEYYSSFKNKGCFSGLSRPRTLLSQFLTPTNVVSVTNFKAHSLPLDLWVICTFCCSAIFCLFPQSYTIVAGGMEGGYSFQTPGANALRIFRPRLETFPQCQSL